MHINLYSLITAIVVGGVAGYLGSLMITKRMALVGDALGHVALPGMGLALLWSFNISLGAFASLLFGVLLIWYLQAGTKLAIETLVGIIFVLSLAIGFLITPEPELIEALIGDISQVSFVNFILSIILSLLVFYVVRKIYSKMMLISLSEDLAVANKVNIRKQNLIYLLAIAFVIALGVKVVGSLLIGALVIIPAATSRNVSRNMRQYIFISIMLGALSGVLGILLLKSTGLPAGPLIILVSISFFIISLPLGKAKTLSRYNI